MRATRRRVIGAGTAALAGWGIAGAPAGCGGRAAVAGQGPQIAHGFAEVGEGVRLHCARAGDDGELVLFLHGFPDFWYLWRRQLVDLGPDRLAVAPDLRGYNLSSKPAGVGSHAMPDLVRDILGLLDHFGREAAVLVGHDWGGWLAWVFTAAFPERVRRLVIINAPHPVPFLRAVTTDPDQNRASQYERWLRDSRAEDTLSARDFDALRAPQYALVQARGLLSDEDRRAYIEAWRRPGTLTGMLNWYRADPIEVPSPDELSDAPPALDLAAHYLAGLPLRAWAMS